VSVNVAAPREAAARNDLPFLRHRSRPATAVRSAPRTVSPVAAPIPVKGHCSARNHRRSRRTGFRAVSVCSPSRRLLPTRSEICGRGAPTNWPAVTPRPCNTAAPTPRHPKIHRAPTDLEATRYASTALLTLSDNHVGRAAVPAGTAVLGYAETATALGHAVADSLTADYLHSTRHHVPWLTFRIFTRPTHISGRLLQPTAPISSDTTASFTLSCVTATFDPFISRTRLVAVALDSRPRRRRVAQWVRYAASQPGSADPEPTGRNITDGPVGQTLLCGRL
jgi:hypothetical protein